MKNKAGGYFIKTICKIKVVILLLLFMGYCNPVYANTSPAITAGTFHSIALKSDGTVWAWGRNSNGQLGIGNTTNRHSPVQVPGLTDVTAITAGYYHSIALKSDGTVWAWGLNNYGQLGIGNTTDQHSPVQVPGLTDVTAITAGHYHSIALKSDG
ncbi:MAG: regulator, partial [Euryarchaeota archaeon]|nr:regulator [Euryarchaeota archaeon]